MLTRQNAKLNFLKSSIKIKTETHDLKLMKPNDILSINASSILGQTKPPFTI